MSVGRVERRRRRGDNSQAALSKEEKEVEDVNTFCALSIASEFELNSDILRMLILGVLELEAGREETSIHQIAPTKSVSIRSDLRYRILASNCPEIHLTCLCFGGSSIG